MRIAISNIAWDPSEDESVALLLKQHSIDAIDIAPSKYFKDVFLTERSDATRVRNWWQHRGIEITGMQSLLFGSSGLNIFGDDHSRKAMLAHLEAVCSIGSALGAKRLVFGSPRNRDRSGVDDATALRMSVDFFRRLGDIALGNHVIVCLEPNPARYGANFMLDSESTASIVRAVDHAAIRLQLDTGAITINAENPVEVISEHADLIGHIHASEPDLITLGDGNSDHGAIGAALRKVLPAHVVSIEMLPAKSEPNLSAIDRALHTAISHYRN